MVYCLFHFCDEYKDKYLYQVTVELAGQGARPHCSSALFAILSYNDLW